MLERFSDHACRVVIQAREEARALNHDWIGTEHLMLGLIGEGSGMAAQVLESLEVPLEGARWLVEQTIGRGEQAPSGQLQFTPRRGRCWSWRRGSLTATTTSAAGTSCSASSGKTTASAP
jgi:ATP-dependent Clp protease ATP-binding subunit ClpA